MEEKLQWLQAFALLAAGAFFLARLLSGMFIINLNVAPSVARHRLRDGSDLLVVQVDLVKGKSGGALRIDRACARWRSQGAQWQHIELQPTNRIDVGRLPEPATDDPDGGEAGRGTWSDLRPAKPLKLPPDESMVLSEYVIVVSPEAVCTVEVLIVGHGWQWWRRGQWRASVVSAPLNCSDNALG